MYTVEDVMKITGYKKSRAYEIIKKVQQQMQRENKNVIILNGRIPIKYFDKYVVCINE